jgi:hypothetical protein
MLSPMHIKNRVKIPSEIRFETTKKIFFYLFLESLTKNNKNLLRRIMEKTKTSTLMLGHLLSFNCKEITGKQITCCKKLYRENSPAR